MEGANRVTNEQIEVALVRHFGPVQGPKEVDSFRERANAVKQTGRYTEVYTGTTTTKESVVIVSIFRDMHGRFFISERASPLSAVAADKLPPAPSPVEDDTNPKLQKRK